MNLVVFSGFIGNIEYKKVNEEFSVCEFSLAHSYKKESGEEVTHWFNFKAYDKRAEFIEKWFKKGSGIDIIGHLSTESWTTKEGNEKRIKTIIVVDKASFPMAKKGDGSPANPLTDEVRKPSPAETMAHPPETNIPSDGKNEDDLPF